MSRLKLIIKGLEAATQSLISYSHAVSVLCLPPWDEREERCSMSAMDFSSSWTVRKSVIFLVNYVVFGTLLQQRKKLFTSHQNPHCYSIMAILIKQKMLVLKWELSFNKSLVRAYHVPVCLRHTGYTNAYRGSEASPLIRLSSDKGGANTWINK